ncbi:hypothetical protein [Actinoplanes regularis]|uniref:Uncharacterized protein n=1 Tax=Actinoplanes regularis TaxID=52697 RepID=A0A238W146_9ACTN|nr:hypothetical protein [Actinoplanes regularis]GIE85353.1 hypothetical protein Are01nite_18330 [Actinoplanes regularis]GLW27543.1 hypothetical protein Areg01_04840 [Actinoplanes regularis]SNR40325.1 hypothetical protein SAMN06264365_10275 [Actinoplanes regularis]
MIEKSGPGHNDTASALRFLTELIAWVATPWALWSYSPILAIAAVVLLIGLPTVFGTPGDKPGGVIVPVPGAVTVLLVLLQIVAAAVAAWVAWPWWAAAPVTVLCLVVPFTELPRWRRLLRTEVPTPDR